MKSGIIDLSLVQVFSAYVIIIVLLLIVKIRGIKREKSIILSSVRMTLQLIFTGYLLVYIFDNPSPWISVCAISLMQIFAVQNVYKRTSTENDKKLKKIIGFSMTAGNLIAITFFLFVVVRVTPWFDPRYVIPAAGMLIGNSMTGVSLGVSKLKEIIYLKRDQIETALIYGASPKEAVKKIVDSCFDAAILPTVNSMLGMGIVFLPGMMTGQILSGTSPVIAIKYQIAMMFGILGSVAFSVILFLHFGSASYFNRNLQLVLNENE